MAISPPEVDRRPGLVESARRPVILAAAVVHLLFLVAPLDVLAPIDPHDLGQRFLHGELPYVDIPFEYPPLAVVPFLVAGLVPSGLAMSSLAVQALLLELVVLWVVVRPRPEAALRFAVLSMLAFPFLSGGFDMYVVTAIAVATHLLARGDARGWWVAAAGVPVKLASATAWVWSRSHLRVAVAAGALAAAVALAPVGAVGLGTDSWLGYSLERGVQVESVAASLAWVGQAVSGEEHVYAYRFRSWELDGAGGAAAVSSVLAVLGLAALALAAWRSRLDPWLASYAAVMLLLVGNKVLSPQFVTWAFPLAAVLGGRWFLLHLGVMGVTVWAYAVADTLDTASAVVVVRNVVLVTAASAALWTCVRAGQRS